MALAENALINDAENHDSDIHFLDSLKQILLLRKTKSHDLIELWNRLGSIEETLRKTY
jgi:hypothetical protein